MLKLLVNISEIIKNDKTKSDLRTSIIGYSVGIVNKINYIIKELIETKIRECEKIEKDILSVEKLRKNTEDKFIEFENIVNAQNESIQQILQFINVPVIDSMIAKVPEKISLNIDKILEKSTKDNTDDVIALQNNHAFENDSIVSNIMNDIKHKQSFTPILFKNINFKDSDFGFEESGGIHEQPNDIGFLTPI